MGISTAKNLYREVIQGALCKNIRNIFISIFTKYKYLIIQRKYILGTNTHSMCSRLLQT